MNDASAAPDPLVGVVRLRIIRHAIDTGHVLQPPQLAEALGQPQDVIEQIVQRLAAGRALILAPNSTTIWAAPPFSAVPSGFRVQIRDTRYWGMCAWDALGVVATAGADTATIRAPCGDCGELLRLDVAGGELIPADLLIHFAIPARRWWENVGFT